METFLFTNAARGQEDVFQDALLEPGGFRLDLRLALEADSLVTHFKLPEVGKFLLEPFFLFFARRRAEDRFEGKSAQFLGLVNELAAFKTKRLQFLDKGNFLLLEQFGLQKAL